MTFDEMFAKLKEETLASIAESSGSFHDEDTFGNGSTFTLEELDYLYLISCPRRGRSWLNSRNLEMSRRVLYKMVVNKVYVDWCTRR